MRGSKAKQIRNRVRDFLGVRVEDTQYEVIEHPAKVRTSLHGKREVYNPRQVKVKSDLRRMILDTKRAYKAALA